MSLKSVRSGLLYLLFLTSTVLVLLELCLRIYFSTQVGPRVLLYGTDLYRNHKSSALIPSLRREFQSRKPTENSVSSHENEMGGYTKFFPHERKVTFDVDTGETFDVSINSRGFRGPDFPPERDEAVIRVITLGSSSTFGYYNRDSTTYPHLLEESLNLRCRDDPRFEVLNLGIPHASSGQILALFRREGLDLDPDVVTFYEGRNDSREVTRPRMHPPTLVERTGSALRERFLIVSFVNQLTASTDQGTLAGVQDVLVDSVGSRFLANVSAIYEECSKRGIHFVVANQQASSQPGFGRSEKYRKQSKGITYQDEIGLIRAKIGRHESIERHEYTFLVHDRLMADLEAWALHNEVPFVDVIALLDEDRHYLLSWVHLHPEANRLIASALADEILRHGCDR